MNSENSKKIPLWAIAGTTKSGHRISSVSGPDVNTALFNAQQKYGTLRDVRTEFLGERYQLPDDNQLCKCHHNQVDQLLCNYGHVSGCHYPMTCQEAKCEYIKPSIDEQIPDEILDTIESADLPDEAEASKLISSWFKDTDKLIDNIYSEVIQCSRCDKTLSEKDEIIQINNLNKINSGWVFHRGCLETK